MISNTFIDDLQYINCKYNFKLREDGRCYSTECMMNQDPEIKEDIKKNGCRLWRRLKEEDRER